MRFINEVWEGLRIAFLAIQNNKLRSGLTTLGIIIGIVMVTSMFTVINGIERSFDNSVSMLGNDVLRVQRFPWGSQPGDWWKYINRPNIEPELAETINNRSSYAKAVAPVSFYVSDVKYKSNQIKGVFMQASTPAYSEINQIKLDTGRFYTEEDNRTARNVCVLGVDVLEALFPNEQPLGKKIKLLSQSFQQTGPGGMGVQMKESQQHCEVIGVLAKQGKFLGLFSFDTQIQMPYNTMKKIFGINKQGLQIQVRVDLAEMDAAQDELTGIIRASRKVKPGDTDNFAINRQEAFRQQFDGIKTVIYSVGIFLTALSLLVGGIGVMNIMFVSVKERTKEIGIRKAIGAPKRAILGQFLFEAVVICVFGGLIGIVLSFGVTAFINTLFTAVMSLGTVSLAFTICVLVGIIFGFIPAWSAANANPIEALRYE
ncbi:MAG TPA: ABC transporter permease [Rhodothermales bacterium]|nr:ABC transporter permease [Rhodothermales bacterium]